jgi:alpha-glucosidase (family GH31 glycosyl hydrolase)
MICTRRGILPLATSTREYILFHESWACDGLCGRESEYRAFVDQLHENKQHYVPLIDAAIGMPDKEDPKDSYEVYTSGHKQEVFLKHPSGEEFIGAVWPG